MKSLLIILGLAISFSCIGQQHIYTVKDSSSFVVFYDTTMHQSNAVPKNTMGVVCGAAYTAVYVLNSKYILADFNNITVVTVAPTNDSACRLFYRICFRIDTGTSIPLNEDSTTFFNGDGYFSKPPQSHILNFLSTGSSTYVNSALSGKTILGITFDGINKYSNAEGYTFVGNTVTWNFNTYTNIAISILYE